MTETRDRHLTPRHRDQRNPKPTSGWLDTHREKQLRDGLRELPELGALAVAALPGERLGGSGARSVPGSKPPLNLAAAALSTLRDLPMPADWPVRDGGLVWVDHRGHIHADDEMPGSLVSVLASWTRLAEAELLEAHQVAVDWRHAAPTPLADQPTVASECAWLARHLVWIVQQQWVVELADDVRRLVRDCRGVLRERPEYRPACPGCHATLVEEASFWHCPDCGTDHRDDRMSLRQVIAKQQPMTVGELTRAFGWSSKTVESWIRRGNLQPVDDEARPRRYHVLDALRLADAGGASMAT